MDDWTNPTNIAKIKPHTTKREKFNRSMALKNKEKLEFIAGHPEGVTAKDFHKAGLNCTGIERLMKLKLVKGTQIREPHRGNRAFHWLWKINQPTTYIE